MERVIIFDQCLQRKQKAWTKTMLIEEINAKLDEKGAFDRRKIRSTGISDSTFYGIVKYLREQYEAPIECKKGEYSYSEEFHFSYSSLTVKEAERLSKMIVLLKELDGVSLMADFEETIARLNSVVQLRLEGNDKIIRFEHHTVQRGMKEYFNKLFDAIASRTEIKIQYQRFSTGIVKTFNFYPYLLKESHNRWYLLGKVVGKKDMITLALDRIEQITLLTEEAFTIDDFDPDVYFSHTIGITVNNNLSPELVKIRVHKSQVPYFETQPLHSSQQKEKSYANGDILLSLNVKINIDLKLLSMQYADVLEIVSPQSLRDELYEALKIGLTNNKI